MTQSHTKTFLAGFMITAGSIGLQACDYMGPQEEKAHPVADLMQNQDEFLPAIDTSFATPVPVTLKR